MQVCGSAMQGRAPPPPRPVPTLCSLWGSSSTEAVCELEEKQLVFGSPAPGVCPLTHLQLERSETGLSVRRQSGQAWGGGREAENAGRTHPSRSLAAHFGACGQVPRGPCSAWPDVAYVGA